MSVPSIWAYRAQLVRVVDGDTIDVTVDAGFANYRTERLRLLGVNAPEMRGPSRPAALAAAGYVTSWLGAVPFDDDWPLVIETHKGDAFGRYLARVWRTTDGRCLNDDLLASGHAVRFMVE